MYKGSSSRECWYLKRAGLQKTFPEYSATPWEYAVSSLKWCFIFHLSGELKNHSDYGKSWFLKMIMKSIISITNKQRDKCMSPWILIPSPKKERKTERKGSCLHVNHLPFMKNESVIIQLNTIKCIANINDKVLIFWKCFNQRPIEFSWLARTISDDLNSIGGSSWHMFLGQLVVLGNGPLTHNKTLHHLCHQQ